MLTIKDIEILNDHKLNIYRRRTKKTQILLYDTQRRADDFLSKIRYRKNGKYEDIPHFLITKLGTIYEIFPTEYSSKTFDEPKIDRRLIKIAIENLGWLSKNTITGFLNNWIGDPYRSEPFVRGWREYYFWDRYTEQQFTSLSNLCDYLCNEYSINKKVVPSQGYMENAHKFKGVVCKSNFSNIYTDINPSFNFKIFFKDEKNDNRI